MFANYLNMLARSLVKYYAIILINYYESIINIFINNILISKSINLKFKLGRLFKVKFWTILVLN